MRYQSACKNNSNNNNNNNNNKKGMQEGKLWSMKCNEIKCIEALLAAKSN